MTDAIGATLAAVLTLAIFSFLYKDNPVYKAAEHLFVGVAAGYYLALQYQQVFRPNLFNPLFHDGKLLNLIPLALCILLFLRLAPRVGWLSRWSMGVLVGAFSGLQVIGFAQGDLVEQIGASMMSLNTGHTWIDISNAILLVGLLASLFYFFFSVEHRGVAGGVARLGIWFLMISFGASYGFTVMARISLLIGRLNFLFFQWPKALGL
ncbi:MAG: hypothetical protein KJ970_05295 [Candidatus Eisenbacteria bacterium]|uniref:Uncharacterized protein n=1 Tax=Eiseniibacteriota bacterium TaxID=2212470 RepID=A0A948W5S2_UNCEI|nr:hypothetical protein [Candidatus Eisenbacteria bacterium]MBU2690325.1 hypothetical protein [Candidatus Eisenbacteria bacterium]